MKQKSLYEELYCDEDIIVVNKTSGIAVIADRYNEDSIHLDSELTCRYGKIYTVHRLDKETSGVMVFARTSASHKNLSAQFEKRETEKIYHALVHGRPLWTEQTVDKPLLIDGDSRHRTLVSAKGKPSETHFTVQYSCGKFSWVEARPLTGRTHQIRVHLADCGLYIVCDPLYSGNQGPVLLSDFKKSWRGDTFEERPLLSRLALHAWQLSFLHPQTNQFISFTAPYPKDLAAVQKQLCKHYKVSFT